jgi:hypothetical protein
MRDVLKIGSLAAMAAFAAIVLYGIAQVQVVNALRPPHDGILLYGLSLCIVIPFMISILALHYVTSEATFWSSAALIFTVMYGTYVTLNYTVQLATVIPAALQHRLDEVHILDQTPHSLFWDIDALSTLRLLVCFAGRSAVDIGIGGHARKCDVGPSQPRWRDLEYA